MSAARVQLLLSQLGDGEPNSIDNPLSDHYQIREEPLYSKAPIKVACIGAGVSGLATAIRVQQTLTNVDFDLYEKNPDLGGTWLENRYPGCACDVPAHAYAYTFEPNPDYSRYYVGSVEIFSYLKAVSIKHDLEKYIRYSHKLISAIWNEEKGVWKLEFEVPVPGHADQTLTIGRECNVLLNACGVLNNWKWPAIPGLHSFAGHLAHSAGWNDTYNYADRAVAVIGSGSSAIQIVPELQPTVKYLKSFIRSPTWITPSQGFVDPKTEGPTNFYYTPEQKEEFRNNPDTFLAYRKQIESDMNRTFETFIRDSQKQKDAYAAFTKLMKGRLGGDETIASQITPKWGVGCRRLTPGPNFLETLVKQNVTVITDEIDRIEPEGLVTRDGTLHKVDALICATGFDTTYRPRFKLAGRRKEPLDKLWEDTNNIEAYLAMAIPDFPNYFSRSMTLMICSLYVTLIIVSTSAFLGPNTPISNGTLIPVIEKQCKYMCRFIEKMQAQRIKAICVKETVTRQLNAHHQKFLQRMVFSDPCRSWYKGGRADGKVIGIWPGSSLHYYETIDVPRYEDYDFVYHDDNMWSFLGNGWTEKELLDRENGGKEDLAYYLIKPQEVLSAPDS